MQLTKGTDYSFRVLIYIGLKPREELSTIQEISDIFSISKSHLMKIVLNLVNAGFIRSIRGPKGGIKMNMDPNKINLRNVLESVETTLQPFNCSQSKCALLEGCKLKGILFNAQEAYLQHLSQFTLAHVIDNHIIESSIDNKKTIKPILSFF